jgi:hypothetical protein
MTMVFDYKSYRNATYLLLLFNYVFIITSVEHNRHASSIHTTTKCQASLIDDSRRRAVQETSCSDDLDD